MKIKYSKPICSLCLTLAVLLMFCGCSTKKVDISSRQSAVLHNADDNGYIPCSTEATNLPDVASPQVFVIDADSGEMIYEKGGNKILYPASTTKLVTILYALTLLEKDEQITPGDELELLKDGSSVAYIKNYHTLTAEMLIEGMLLPSGNDAALALAAAAGRRLTSNVSITGKAAVELFVEGMNEYAKSVGMCGSHFISPDGYYDAENYSTLEDMALISLLASKNETVMKYACLASDKVTYASGHTNEWVNTNLLLHKDSEFYCENVTGLKTGSSKGDCCLVCTVRTEHGNYICGVFTSHDDQTRFGDMKKIVDYLSE